MNAPRDGTQERRLDPPDNMLSDADMLACERAAREGFDAMDARAREWLAGQLADTPNDMARLVIFALKTSAISPTAPRPCAVVRDRYIAECAEEYDADLTEQAAHAQEDR